MKFHIGPIPESPDFRVDDSWKPIRELPPTKLLLYSTPIAILLLELFGHFWGVRFGTSAHAAMLPASLPFVLLLLVTVALHELIHAIALPGFPWSSKCVMGIWPSRLAPYVHYDGTLSRDRVVFFSAAPFLALSVLPVGLAFLTGVESQMLAAVSILNAAGSSADFVGAVLVLRQIPRGALVRNQGWKTFWKKPYE